MTEDDVSAKERLLTDYEEAKAHVATLKAEADRLGQMLHSLGRQLSNAPESLSVNGQSLDMRFGHGRKNFVGQLPTTEAVSALCHNIRESLIHLHQLVDEMRSRGAL